MNSDGWRVANCPNWCVGHMDPDTESIHSADWDRFGKDSPVVVNKTDGTPAVVCLNDLPHPVTTLTPAQARTLANQLQQAADFADRANESEMTGHVFNAFVLGLLAAAGRQSAQVATARTELAA